MSTEPLSVPDSALRALFEFFMDYETDDEARADVRAVAAPVVAAELRRLAPLLADRGSSADLLRARADELDPDPEEQR